MKTPILLCLIVTCKTIKRNTRNLPLVENQTLDDHTLFFIKTFYIWLFNIIRSFHLLPTFLGPLVEKVWRTKYLFCSEPYTKSEPYTNQNWIDSELNVPGDELS